MASYPTTASAFDPGTVARLRGVAAVLLATAFAVAGCSGSSRDFHLSGSITATPRVLKSSAKPNTVLHVVATNNAGVPVAVKRIINPALPLRYTIDEDNLVLPGPVWKGPLTVTVHVNMRGKP
ncbi:hypothetical protein ACFL2T_06155, partial [Elusimicrobiota bacterium]